VDGVAGIGASTKNPGFNKPRAVAF
jgi:hypothetical protein